MAEANAATGGEQTDARGGWDDFVVIDLHADGRVTASGDGARNAQDSSSDGGDAAPASSNSQVHTSLERVGLSTCFDLPQQFASRLFIAVYVMSSLVMFARFESSNFKFDVYQMG